MDNKYKSVPLKSSEITPYSQYLSRRDFLRTAGIVTGSALLAASLLGVLLTYLLQWLQRRMMPWQQ